MTHSSQSGVTTLMVIAYMGIFLLILGTITSFAFEEAKYGRALYGREQALHIAEAGLEYYRWYLAHNPNNLTNGTGLAGPYTYTVSDPEGGTLGSAAISVVGNSQCGQIQNIDLSSKGTANISTGFTRTLTARYMQQSVAWYSSVLNSAVWPVGDITGPYFSNFGIRMDANNNSDVLSAVSTWNCTSSYGCVPTQSTAPGVVGSGAGSALWHYPVSTIDFSAMNTNLSTLKGYAQNNGGLYFAAASGSQNQRGYHLIFNSAGTVTVKQVSATYSVPSYSNDTNDLSRSSGWTATEYSIIKTETAGTTYAIPSSCSLIFVEDRAWIEGTVKGKVTVVVATPSDGVASTVPTTAYLLNNINYTNNNGTSGLTVIAEDNVQIPLNSPDSMTLHGIFVAQGGSFGRSFYINDNANYGAYSVGYATSTWNSYPFRTLLTTEGTVVSNLRVGTQWVDGSNNVTSGYRNRVASYDELQATNPPPFTPAASTNYGFFSWKEQ